MDKNQYNKYCHLLSNLISLLEKHRNIQYKFMYTNKTKTLYPYDILIFHKVENLICEIYIIQYVHFSFKWIVSNCIVVVVFFYQLYLINCEVIQ